MEAFVVVAWFNNDKRWFSVDAKSPDEAWRSTRRHLRATQQIDFADAGVVIAENDVFNVQPDPIHGDWLKRVDSLQANQWRRNASEARPEYEKLP